MIRSDRSVIVGLLVALAAGATLPVSRALAEPSAVKKSAGDTLFFEGKKLFEAKKYDEACPKLEQSAALQPGGGVQLAMALCHEAQGKLATAMSDFREALALAKRDKREERIKIATEAMARIEPKLSKIVVLVSEGAKAQSPSVELDGVPLPPGSWGSAIPVDGGPHVVVASAAGKTSSKTEVTVGAEKDRKEITVAPLEGEAVVAPPPIKDVPPPPSTVTSSDAKPKKGGAGIGPYLVGGLGVVALGVGTVFGLKALSASSDVKSGCNGGACPTTDLVDRNDQAKRSARIADVTLGLGVVAVAGAVIWYVSAPRGESDAKSTGKTSGNFVADVGPSGAGVGWVMPW